MTKEQYISQYWGQKVLCFEDLLMKDRQCVVNGQNAYRFSTSHLELRSISQLTDEEYSKVANISKPNQEGVTKKQSAIYGAYVCRNMDSLMLTGKKYFAIHDYLISIGINLSTEALQKEYCKIKES